MHDWIMALEIVQNG